MRPGCITSRALVNSSCCLCDARLSHEHDVCRNVWLKLYAGLTLTRFQLRHLASMGMTETGKKSFRITKQIAACTPPASRTACRCPCKRNRHREGVGKTNKNKSTHSHTHTHIPSHRQTCVPRKWYMSSRADSPERCRRQPGA